MHRFDKQATPVSGFLLVNKPAGLTSHDVVDVVRRSRHVRRAGHGGSLDPMATGLLIIGIGSATKELGTVLKLPKTYKGEITLGARSTTDDAGGTITPLPRSLVPSREDIEKALAKFRGTILQRPPAFSAVKIRGVPAYKRARRGEDVLPKERLVTITDLRLHCYDFPILELHATVSSGTYIRSLARDIGESLGTGGYLSALERRSIGPYRLEDAVPLGAVRDVPLLHSLDEEPHG